MSKAQQPVSRESQGDLYADYPPQPVPLSLYQRVTRGVRIAAWRRKEEIRFRYALVTWSVCLLLVITAAVSLFVVTHFVDVVENGISGGLGWWDYYASAAHVALANYTGAYSLGAAALVAVGALLLGLLPFSRFMKGH